MPSFIGNVKINAIGGSGVLNAGDTIYISPKETGKTFTGANSFKTGDFLLSKQFVSTTNSIDNDFIEADQFASR